MAVVKISVSVDEKELEEARGRVGSRGLSGYLTDALRSENRRRRQLEFLAELDREFGPIADDHPDAVRAAKTWKEFVSSSTRAPSRRSRKAKPTPAVSSKKR